MPSDLYTKADAGQPGFVLTDDTIAVPVDGFGYGVAFDSQGNIDPNILDVLTTVQLSAVDSLSTPLTIRAEFGTYTDPSNFPGNGGESVNIQRGVAGQRSQLNLAIDTTGAKVPFNGYTKAGDLLPPITVPSNQGVILPLPLKYQYAIKPVQLEDGVYPCVSFIIGTVGGGATLTACNFTLWFNEFRP